MSQKFSLYEDLKVWENIRLFAGIYGMKDKEIAVKTDELLARLGFSDERDTLVRSLPLGWKQKLLFPFPSFMSRRLSFWMSLPEESIPPPADSFGSLSIRLPTGELPFLLPPTIWMRQSIVTVFLSWWTGVSRRSTHLFG